MFLIQLQVFLVWSNRHAATEMPIVGQIPLRWMTQSIWKVLSPTKFFLDLIIYCSKLLHYQKCLILDLRYWSIIRAETIRQNDLSSIRPCTTSKINLHVYLWKLPSPLRDFTAYLYRHKFHSHLLYMVASYINCPPWHNLDTRSSKIIVVDAQQFYEL